ncbi:hypothetical protein WA158_006682 [Blastocystis sp. Blastoise]
MSQFSQFKDLPIFIISFIYILLAPYTKVEESFNVQATHDILYLGSNINQYDHNEFPGVVPRTFIGALILSFMSSPYVILSKYFHLPKFFTLIVVRACLSFLNYLSLRSLRKAIEKHYQSSTGTCFTFLLCLQFHLLFYMSRPLPNSFALILTTFGWAAYLNKEYKYIYIDIFNKYNII